jgi:hypothetical protein
MAALNLTSAAGQDRVLASTIATAARVDETALQPNGPDCAANVRGRFTQTEFNNSNTAFKALVAALAAFENAPLPRGKDAVAPLRAASANAEKANLGEPRTVAALASVKEQLRAYDLRDEVLKLGRPPWKSADAMKVAKAKVELDLLSRPANNQQAVPLGAGAQGMYSSYWIKKSAGTGGEEKSYICKPTVATPQDGSTALEGFPNGGEVAREALAGRVAESLKVRLGLDMNMPETHAIEMDPRFFPQGVNAPGGKVTCSVQEFRGGGPAMGTPLSDLAQVPRDQCHALALLDTAILNTDRHGENIMIDGHDLIPIDHGASFPDPAIDGGAGLRRIGRTMATTNVLLRMPGTHEPMTKEVRKQLSKMKSTKVAEDAARKRDEAGQVNQDLNDPSLLSAGALKMSQRSTRFMKLAAGYDGMSPATIQVALGSNATELLDPALPDNQFDALAQQVLQQALKDQPLIKSLCLLNDSEHAQLCAELNQLGWSVGERNTPPGHDLLSDPALAMKILAQRVAKPANIPPRQQLAAARAELATPENQAGAAPDYVKTRLAQVKGRALTALIAMVRGPLQAQFTTDARTAITAAATTDARLQAISDVSNQAFDTLRRNMKAEVDALQQAGTWTQQVADQWRTPLARGRLADVDAQLNGVANYVRPNMT